MLLMERYTLYSDTFQQIDGYLESLQGYWKFEAFHHGDYPWVKSNKDLCNFLDALSDNELLLYQQYPEKLYPQLKDFIPLLRPCNDPLFAIKVLSKTESVCSSNHDSPFWLKAGIKGRKWSQISAFAQQVNTQHPIIEWCAGKGHLGRLISWQKQLSVTSVEWKQKLCDLGSTEAIKMQIPQIFKQADVLIGEADSYINEACHVIALHACGDLHSHLINQAKKSKPAQLSISPCCYHLTTQTIYQPCSVVGKKSTLQINKQLLKLAVSKQVTTGKRQSRLSNKEVLWRLSFDELQKNCLQSENYFPLPSFPTTLLSGQFTEFVSWAMKKKLLTFDLPELLDSFLELATKRLKKVRRMELISQFFVRPLELWLVYDRALTLQDSGYQVTVSTFCDEQITPRNLLIQAKLLANSSIQ
jgi:hypothetical protein